MDFDQHENCRSCALGNPKLKHNYDEKYCRLGRLQVIGSLPVKDQIQALYVEECMSLKLAEYIIHLAQERKQTILDVLRSEKIKSGLN